LQQFISSEELGNCKPTQLLHQMQQLLCDHFSFSSEVLSFLRELFLQRLLANVRMILASGDALMDLNKLADTADKIMEVFTSSVSVGETGRPNHQSDLCSRPLSH